MIVRNEVLLIILTRLDLITFSLVGIFAFELPSMVAK